LKKKYIYADRQILAQHDIDEGAQPVQDDKYFYMHDRLGSVRLVIYYDEQTQDVVVVNYYTYEPFGEAIDTDVTLENPFMFTGQYYDAEIEEYYLRARQYNPQIARFTSRDPVRGKFREPLTLHRYLYCQNDPINRVDLNGKFSIQGVAQNLAIRAFTSGLINSALSGVRSHFTGGDFWKGTISGFAGGVSGAIAGGVFSSFSAAGYIAAAVSAGVGAGFEAALKEEGVSMRAFGRVVANTLGGAILGVGSNWGLSKVKDVTVAAIGFPGDLAMDYSKDLGKVLGVWDTFTGGVGGNIASMIDTILFDD